MLSLHVTGLCRPVLSSCRSLHWLVTHKEIRTRRSEAAQLVDADLPVDHLGWLYISRSSVQVRYLLCQSIMEALFRPPDGLLEGGKSRVIVTLGVS
jgi:hypothetical protein